MLEAWLDYHRATLLMKCADLSASQLRLRSAEPSTLSLLIGFLLVGIPALDTCLVIVSRRRRGVSILTGGQEQVRMPSFLVTGQCDSTPKHGHHPRRHNRWQLPLGLEV